MNNFQVKIDLKLLTIIIIYGFLFSIVASEGLILSSLLVISFGIASVGYYVNHPVIVKFVDTYF